MNRDEYHRKGSVDVLTIILGFLFCLWLGWWGLLPSFAIGFAINVYFKVKK